MRHKLVSHGTSKVLVFTIPEDLFPDKLEKLGFCNRGAFANPTHSIPPCHHSSVLRKTIFGHGRRAQGTEKYDARPGAQKWILEGYMAVNMLLRESCWRRHCFST